MNWIEKQKREEREAAAARSVEQRMYDAAGEAPHADSAERHMVSACFVDANAIETVKAIIEPDHIWRRPVKLVYEAMLDLHANGIAHDDVVTVLDWLQANGLLEAAGGDKAVVALSHETPSAVRVAAYALTVRKRAARRHIVTTTRIIEDIARESSSDSDCLKEIAPYIEELNREKAVLHGTDEGVSQADAVAEARKDMEDRLEGKGTGLPLPWRSLAQMLGTIFPTHLTIIGARPSMGKSAFAVQWLSHIAAKGIPCLCLTMEMSRVETVNRIAATLSGLDYSAISASPPLFESMDEVETYGLALVRQEAWPIRWHTERMDVFTLRETVRRAIRRHGVRVVFVDYIQLMPGSRRGMSEYDAASEVSRELKAIAQDFEINVIGVAQLNRGVESRTDKRPLMSDLRSTGQIEQDANQVIMLYRDDYYNEGSDDEGIAEVIVRKNRGNKLGTQRMRWFGPQLKFAELDEWRDV